MDKKIIGIVIAIVAVIAVLAIAGGALTQEDKIVTVDGVNFTVPSGFEEDPDGEKINLSDSSGAVNYVINSKAFIEDDDIVTLFVANYGEHNINESFLSELGGNAKTINGVEGYYMVEDDDVHTFAYVKDGKLVMVISNDEDVIDRFVL